MDKLPPELLHRIFFVLDFQTKLVCLTICRRWWRVLDKYRLFYRVDIKTNNLDRLHGMMDMFKQLPECATKVVDLDIVLETYTLFNRRVLFNIFIISTLPQQNAGFYRPKAYEGPIDVLHSNARIECLNDFYHCELVSQLVYSNLGQRLKTLHLNFTTEVC
jgi:hypothetical protein